MTLPVAFIIILCLVYGPSYAQITGIDNGGPPVQEIIGMAIQQSQRTLESMDSMNRRAFMEGIDSPIGKGSARWHHSMITRLMEPAKNMRLNYKAHLACHATEGYLNMTGLPLPNALNDPDFLEMWRTMIAPYCRNPVPICNRRARYRTADGTCNNLLHPTWGSSNKPQARLLPPAYRNGLDKPRTLGRNGMPLVSTRIVSNVLFDQRLCKRRISKRMSVMFMAYGQFLDHDLVFTPVTKGFNDADIQCCMGRISRRDRDACFPIRIPVTDEHFHFRCMNFVRSATAPQTNCDPGPLNQLNQHSSYIDASMVYGATADEARSLRANYGGRLRTFGSKFMPPAGEDTCMIERPGDFCFLTGDMRRMEVPNLQYLHTVFLREHNRIAGKLSIINRHWSNEKIYQETRKIIAALLQHITYMEYLPLLLNKHYRAKFGLLQRSPDYDTVYDPHLDATLANVFNVAAFRFGHSEISDTVDSFNIRGQRQLQNPIERTFNRPTMMLSRRGRGYDGIGRWLLYDRQSQDDRCFADGIRNRLFQDNRGMSFDLPALNTQRGRDHGIPSYNEWRMFCGLPPVTHFGPGPGGMANHEPHVGFDFSRLYKHPDDIDLFPGAISERKVPGGLTGPTFQCILGHEFKKLKFGDRFWYENQNPRTGFTLPQLHQIKKVRLSSVICTSTLVKKIQRNAFIVPSFRNPAIPCPLLPQIDLRMWKEVPSIRVTGPGITVPIAKML